MLIQVPTTATTASIETDDLRTVLTIVGFPADKIDQAQAIAQAESQGYEDAVGDLSLITAKYGPSIGLFQIRSLRSPPSYGGLDLWRFAWPLRNRFFNAAAALAQSKGGTDWTSWSTFTKPATGDAPYVQYLGQSPQIKTGHSRQADWWR